MRGETIRLDDGHARLTVAAEGGAILRYDALLAGRAPMPLMKPAEGGQAFGCQVLVPFSNRISGGGFNFDGRFHADRTERARRSISDPWRRLPEAMAGGEQLADGGGAGAGPWLDRAVPVRRAPQVRSGRGRAHCDDRGREPRCDPAALRARLPSLVSPPSRHDAACQGRARLAGGREAPAHGRGAGRLTPPVGLLAAVAAAPGVGEQRLRRVGSPRGDRPARGRTSRCPSRHHPSSASTYYTHHLPMPVSSASSRYRMSSTRITARG